MTSPDEPLTWSIVANVSREVFTRQRTDSRRPGTRHFVPGAKVWVLPILWGDGGDQRYVVGTRRGTGGRGLIRLVLNTAHLVNFRVKPVYSPAVYAAMGQPETADRCLPLYESQEDAQRSAGSWRWARTRAPHLGLAEWLTAMHNADEMCEFCDGRDAALAGVDHNPHPVPADEPEGTVDWWSTGHGMWRCGWLTERHRLNPAVLTDLGVRHIALSRRKLRQKAEWLARTVTGRTVAELESEGIGRNRLRFVRGDYQPRLLDGIVHAWIDDDERVIRTQTG